MKKQKIIAAALSLALTFGTAPAFASDTFQKIYEASYFTQDLKDNQATTEKFNTDYGELKFQIRRLWNAKSEDKLHAMAWLNGTKVYDTYFPDVDNGYTFRAIKDTANNRQFYVMQSIERSYLIGYSPITKRIELYVDSQNYYNSVKGYPYFTVTNNGQLILSFENSRSGACHRYRFMWDDSSNWFSYTDLGTGWQSVIKEQQR